MVQMPALNTPQFDWVKSRLPRKPQPVPPIYQPEVAAEAIVHAAHHYRREWYVGWSTVVAIVGNKIAPGFGDWYLGQQGYDAQQYDGKRDPNRPNNLYEPVDEDVDHGAHGDFDEPGARLQLATLGGPEPRLDRPGRRAGGLCDACSNGLGKAWRGGLVGLSLGTLGRRGTGRTGPPREFGAGRARQRVADAIGRRAAAWWPSNQRRQSVAGADARRLLARFLDAERCVTWIDKETIH